MCLTLLMNAAHFNDGQLKCITALLAFTTLVLGLVAARYWLKASKVETIPQWVKSGQIETVIHSQATDDWIVGLLQAGQEAGRLNAIAARWTAAAVIAGCLTSIAGIWPVS